MKQSIVHFKKLHAEAKMPTYGTDHAAGMDFYAPDDVEIPPFALGFKLMLGIAVELPEGYELQMRMRSGMAKTALRASLTPGTVDSDYRGELAMLFDNQLDRPVQIKRGDRVAQGVLAKYIRAAFIEVTDLAESKRGTGGFGSTGR